MINARIFVVAASLALATPALLLADQTDPRLEQLFSALQAADDVTAGETVASDIWAIWLEIEDPSAALLMRQGIFQIQTRRLERALSTFNQLTAKYAEIAEGWNKRATVRYLLGDLDGSVGDIQRTLALEPRHFGALSGLGMIYLQQDDPQGALAAFEQVLAVHPTLRGIEQRVRALEEQIDGRSL